MKRNTVILAIILLFSSLLASETAYIQVISEPGISVFLDNIFKGKTTQDMGGIIVENVEGGVHTIKFIKTGYKLQESSIFIRAGEVFTYTVQPFNPKISISEKGNTDEQNIDLQVGSLKIQSLPIQIDINIPSLGVNRKKSMDEWEASNIPQGNYDAEFRWEGRVLSETINIHSDWQTHLFVNMVKFEIEIKSKFLSEKERIAKKEKLRQEFLKNHGGNFILVKGGTFNIGSTIGDSDEKPRHSITVSDFYIGKYEVTQSQYEKVVGVNPSEYLGSNNPVVMVTWYNVIEFCNRLSEISGFDAVYTINGTNVESDSSKNGFRLPTEAEWEYAARGGNKSKGYIYSGSNSIEDVAIYNSNNGGKIHSVGQKQPNELGIFDMSGNVWEWCWDWYEGYSSNSKTSPRGASWGSYRVLRGGGWTGRALYCRSANRNYYSPSRRYSDYGFRLARNVE